MVRDITQLPRDEEALNAWLTDVQKAKNPNETTWGKRLVIEKNQLVYDPRGVAKTDFREIVSFCAEHGFVSKGMTKQIEAYNAKKKGMKRIDSTTVAVIKVFEAIKANKLEELAGIQSRGLLTSLRNAVSLGRADVVKKLIRVIDDDQIRISYEDLKACPKENLKGMLQVLKGLPTVGTIVKKAFAYNDHALLKLMQKEGVVDSNKNTVAHLLCLMKPTAFTEGFFPSIVRDATREQLNAQNDNDQSILELAYLGGHVSVVATLIESAKVDLFAVGGYTRERALNKLCYLSDTSTPKRLRQHDQIAKKLVAAASREQLLVKSKDKTILEIACQNKQQAIVNAIVKRLVQTIQPDDHLALWWNEILQQDLPDSAVQLIVAGFQQAARQPAPLPEHLKAIQAICERYETLKTAGLALLDALRCSFVLEKNMPKHAVSCKVDLNQFKHDLVHAKLSNEAVAAIIHELGDGRVTSPAQDQLQAIIEKYNEITKNVKRVHLRAQEAIATAIIVAHDIPKVEAVKQKVLQGAGYLDIESSVLPKGWKLFKEQGKISVITGHKLGEGTFKKAHTTVLFALANEVASKPLPAVHLLTDRTKNQREERQHEVEVSLLLNSSPSVIRTHTARVEVEGKFNQLGMIVEMGESDLEHALSDVEDRSVPQVLSRLEIFQDIVSGIADMHARDIVHGDIKVANGYVVLDEHGKKRGKVSDFGTAVYSTRPLPSWSTFKKRAYGSPANTAPELCFSQSNIADIDLKKTDVWACGMALKAMYSGKSKEFSWAEDLNEIDQATFQARLKKELLDPIAAFKRAEAAGTLSAEDKAQYKVFLLIEKMLQEDPAKRLTVEELLAEIKIVLAEIRSLL